MTMGDELPREPAAVRSTYERIASDFDRTRSHPWPAVERFVEAHADGGVALDLGCGNGRHLELLRGRVDRRVGVDLSRAMLHRTAARVDAVDLVEASATALPLVDDRIALGLYVATVHHLPDRRRRVASLDEFARVLDPAGAGLVSVWSVDHETFDLTAASDRVVDWTLPDGSTVPRYYFIYDRPTFVADLGDSSLVAERVWAASGNLFAHVVAPR